jgi:hypothetical protein
MHNNKTRKYEEKDTRHRRSIQVNQHLTNMSYKKRHREIRKENNTNQRKKEDIISQS